MSLLKDILLSEKTYEATLDALQRKEQEYMNQAHLEIMLGDSGGFYADKASGAHRDLRSLKIHKFIPGMHVQHTALHFVGTVMSICNVYAIVQWPAEATGYIGPKTNFRHIVPLNTDEELADALTLFELLYDRKTGTLHAR